MLLDPLSKIVTTKARYFKDFDELGDSSMPCFVVSMTESPDPAVGSLSLAGFSHIGSIFKKFPSKEDLLLYQDLKKAHPGIRISSFRVGRVLPWLRKGDSDDPAFIQSRGEKWQDSAYAIGSQFLPARFREIESKDLALAIRLNFETCEPEYTAEGVEELNFVDCMKIIGSEDKI